MTTIINLGSISDLEGFSSSSIQDALGTTKIEMEQGEDFTGRPGTVIYVKDNIVVKLKYDAVFKDPKIASEWVNKHRAREAEIAIHHPKKTWFVLQEGMDYVCGNAAPHLTPLHIYFQLEHFQFEVLGALISLYLRFSAKENLRLDEGLSNFGLDEDGALYYLDDDIYSWDDFLSFCQMLGVYLRTLEWITPALSTRLAAHIYRRVMEEFGDLNWVRVISEQVGDIFVPRALKEVFDAFQNSLLNEMRDAARSNKQRNDSDQLPLQDRIPDFTGVGKIAILADVHANLPALNAVAKDMELRGISQALIVGDIVGYGPHPSECIRLIAERGFSCIKGNHDHAAAGGGNDDRFSYTGKISNGWTRSQLNGEEQNWLLHLPPIYKCDRFMAVHGAPIDHTFFNGYVYHMTYERNLDYMEKHGISLCFHGHTHMGGIYCRETWKEDAFLTDTRHQLLENSYYLVCPGSVGQPRNGVPGASYCIYDASDNAIEFVHVDYNIETAIRDMKGRDQPEPLIQFQEKMLSGR